MADDEYASLTKTELTPIARALAVAMSDLSETCWAAGWMSGTSEAIWSLIHNDLWQNVWSATPDEIEMFATLADQCGYWIVYDMERGEVAVPLDEWRAHYARWLADRRDQECRPRLPAPIHPGGFLNPLPASLRPDDRWTPLFYDDEPCTFHAKTRPVPAGSAPQEQTP